jgi:GTP-binding protein
MSQFVDEARIFVQSGKGGNGIISFRREKFVPRGGPDGGDGGHGGDVILVANPKLNTLRAFGQNVHHRAPDGKNGGRQRCTGASGQALILEVPLGTLIRAEESGQVIADLNQEGQQVIVAKGGRGGRGNTHWTTSRNQAPMVAEKGEPGEAHWLRLELKLLADVGIIGMPNAGKSTLLSVISNAKPAIAPYPFTTLNPQLGVVNLGYRDLVFADIPGLIEGASQGAGLGHAFLRHIQRTRLLVHIVDGSSADPLADFHQINTELLLFDDRLRQRPQLVVVNKMDLPDAQEKWPSLEVAFKGLGYPVLAISAATQRHTRDLVNRAFNMFDDLPAPPPVVTPESLPVYTLPEDDKEFRVEKLGAGEFRVSGKRIERTVAMTYWGYDDAVRRFQRILETLGISAALEARGIKVGDKVIIGDTELEWGE